MRRWGAALVLALVCAGPARALDGTRLGVRDGRLVDAHGHEVTLRGVNARAAGIFDANDLPDFFEPRESQKPGRHTARRAVV